MKLKSCQTLNPAGETNLCSGEVLTSPPTEVWGWITSYVDYGMDFLSVCQVLHVVASLPHEHLGHLLSEQRYFVLVFATPSSL